MIELQRVIFVLIIVISLNEKVIGQGILIVAGERISIDQTVSIKNGIKSVTAAYRVLEVLQGSFQRDTIKFQAAVILLSDSKRAMLSLTTENDGSYRLVYSSPIYSKEEKKIFVFVGSKISIEQFDPKYPDGTIIMDNAYKAKYKIVQDVYGNFGRDTIECEVYDHYGIPAFSKFDKVLLYVSEGKNFTLYHEKYMFSPVYLTKDGRWADGELC